MKKGLFITLEGIDGAGKSVQMELLRGWLTEAGYSVLLTREPGGCPISEAIRDLLLDPQYEGMTPETEMLLYAAARAQHVRTVIRPALEAGCIVISDRYIDSSLAYQGCAHGLGIDRVRRVNEEVTDGLYPDIALFLALDAEAARTRIRGRGRTADRIEREGSSTQTLAYEGYLAVAAAEPLRVALLDAGQSVEALAREIRERVEPLLER